ncbi:hypothetical protein M8J76_015606 [Diaphorina citri]|nr:hypothetical protein M8J76_015606 [Diaphorina citri]
MSQHQREHVTTVAIRSHNNPGTVDMVALAAPSSPMALFGMVWLLRLRSELRQCAQCRSDAHRRARYEQLMQHRNMPGSSNAPIFTVDTSTQPGTGPDLTFCQVHGYVSHPSKDDIQEFYELTLLDDSKTIQQKTAETIRIANKWETSDGTIAPGYYVKNEVDLHESLSEALLNLKREQRSVTPPSDEFEMNFSQVYI